MDEGWYLISNRDLEMILRDVSAGNEPALAATVQKLSIDEALAYRNAGNVPDQLGRSLRLVLTVGDGGVQA
ncbi:MAG: hypothetical protein M3238_08780, partial [Actinomycetota bacterium]|nr:hypothetical protein [Actinomycetota bacterium]